MVLEEVDDPAIVADLGRIREAGRTLLALVDEILSPEALSTSEDRNLESFGSRMRAELRNPVNAIIGYVEIVMEAVSETGRSDLLGDLERIRGAARRLLESGEELLSTVDRPGGEGHVVHGALRESSRLTHGVLSRIRPVGDRDVVPRVEREGRILVVDDNVMSRDLLSRGLARAGYMVTEAEDGQSALALLEEQTFDVILLDVIMPRLNGVETLLRLRSQDHLAEVPVVMLSSLDEVDAVVRCIELGAEEYLVKPVPPSVLEARVAANVELRRVRNLSREYHDRLQQDEIFIEDLLARWVPARFAPRVRAGDQIVEESYLEATAVCCLLGRGSTTPAGVRSLYPRLEALMEEVGVEMSLWRPGRLVALVEASGERPYHAEVVADLALALAGALESSGEPATFRMGIHTGPAAGGILGGARFRFELWGEAVELAEKLAVSAPESGIVVTTSTHGALRGAYALESRGIAEVEGGGRMRIYQLHGRAQKGNVTAPAQG
jgi:CheY-like chemotaxis protein